MESKLPKKYYIRVEVDDTFQEARKCNCQEVKND